MGEVIYPVEFCGWQDAVKLPPDLRKKWLKAEDKRAWDLLFNRERIPLDHVPPRCEVIDITPFLTRRTYPQ